MTIRVLIADDQELVRAGRMTQQRSFVSTAWSS
jgi:hypothetical protein